MSTHTTASSLAQRIVATIRTVGDDNGYERPRIGASFTFDGEELWQPASFWEGLGTILQTAEHRPDVAAFVRIVAAYLPEFEPGEGRAIAELLCSMADELEGRHAPPIAA